MSWFETKNGESASWLQRMAMASEFELSMAGFGLMGEPGSMAERLAITEVDSSPSSETDIDETWPVNNGLATTRTQRATPDRYCHE